MFVRRDLPAVGIAYSGYVPSFLDAYPDSLDYVEIPFELLRHDPRVVEVRSRVPIVLHCASLSIGGALQCPDETICEIGSWVEKTDTPWIGEHLAFITANRFEAGPCALPYAENEPYNVGYTVSPPMNSQTLERTVKNIKNYQRQLPVRLLVENSPMYFEVPTSEMSQAEFLTGLCSQTEVGVLLDLAHLYISSRNMGFDPIEELERFPLENVVEVHISGIDQQQDGLWDDHANSAPAIVYDMLSRLAQVIRPKAITLEYNWSVRFPASALLSELQRVRDTLSRVNYVASHD